MKMTCTLPDHAAVVEALLEGFVLACRVCIEAGLAPLDPSDTNVRYQMEPPGSEDWVLPQNVMRAGWGDCEDLAGWRAAGMRVSGEDDGARVVVVKTGKGKLHAVVQKSDGSYSDPSRELQQRQKQQLGASATITPGGGGGQSPGFWGVLRPQAARRPGTPQTVQVGPGSAAHGGPADQQTSTVSITKQGGANRLLNSQLEQGNQMPQAIRPTGMPSPAVQAQIDAQQAAQDAADQAAYEQQMYMQQMQYGGQAGGGYGGYGGGYSDDYGGYADAPFADYGDDDEPPPVQRRHRHRRHHSGDDPSNPANPDDGSDDVATMDPAVQSLIDIAQQAVDY